MKKEEKNLKESKLSPNGFTFPKALRLRKKKDYQRVYQGRKQVRNHLLKIFYLPQDKGFSRLGMSVSRRVARGVRRNRIRRLIREAFRLNQHQIPKGYDFIVIPLFQQERVPPFQEIQESLLCLTGKIAYREANKQRKKHKNSQEIKGKENQNQESSK